MQQLYEDVGAGFDGIRGAIDGVVLPDFMAQLLRDRRVVNRVPVFFGHNVDDSFVFVCTSLPASLDITEALFNATLRERFEQTLGVPSHFVDEILAAYPFAQCAVPGDVPATRNACCAQLRQTLMDYVWLCQDRMLFRAMRAQQGTPPMYSYYFGEPQHCPATQSTESQHTMELPYVFATESSYLASGTEEPPCTWSPAVRTFSDRMVDMWLAFAATLDPSTAEHSVPAWVPSDAGEEQTIYLKQGEIALKPFAVADVQRCSAFWDPLRARLQDFERSQAGF
jgi:carboxylesterase type B